MFSLQWPSPAALRAHYCSAGKFVCGARRWRHQRRTTDSFVLFLGCKGTVHIRQGKEEYLLEPDGYLILLADTEHEGTRFSSPEYYWCHFTLPDAVQTVSVPQSTCALPLQGKLSSPEAQRLLFCQMADSAKHGEETAQTLCDRLLEALLLGLTQQRHPPNRSPLIANVVQYLRLNATQLREVGEVAEHFGYNKEYLTTLLRKATGKTLTEHILFFRTQKAKEMLWQTDLPVSQVAYACGFADEKYFFRLFKRQTGLSPARYRLSRPQVLWNNR